MSVVILVAHPALHRSRMNARLIEVAAKLEGVDIVDLYELYPEFDIDVAVEQERLLGADAIVLQHPLYSYSTPALLKESVDLTFEHGFAYGSGTEKLKGKVFTQAITAGGDEASYQHGGFNKFTIDELTQPMQATANFCGMEWRQPVVAHGGHYIDQDGVHAACDLYDGWLQNLIKEVPHGSRS